ncbi:MAG: FecR domain-containing protein [Proteobacteria bacterium]|nr:FecR domain-containing protein [Pseudomonadota bacterium]
MSVRLLWGVLCALLLGVGAAMAQAASDTGAPQGDNRQGTFKTVQGEVVVERGGKRVPVSSGAPLMALDRIVTGPRSAASVILRDGTVLALGPDSSVNLAEFRFDPTTQEGNILISMAKGSLRMVSGLIAKLKPEQVKITTPTSVIGVRGTDFIVETHS